MKGLLSVAVAASALVAFSPASAQSKDEVKDRAKEIAAQANQVEQRAGKLANEIENQQATDRDRDRQGNNSAATRDGRGKADGKDDDGDNDNDGGGKSGLLGLLGLLGLAGLMGLRRRDDHVHPVRTTDTRTDTRL